MKTRHLALCFILSSLLSGACTFRDRSYAALEEATAYLNKGWYQRALGSYTKILKSQPDSAAAHYGRGKALEGLGKNAEACEEIQSALKIDSANADYFIELGNTFKSRHLPQNAVEAYNQALKIKPDLVSPLTNRGTAYLDLKEYALARDDLTHAIKLNPHDPSYFALRGNANIGLKDYKQALTDYSEALKLSPDWPDYLCCKAITESLLKQYLSAIQDFEACLAKNPKHGRALNGLAATCMLTGNYPRAITCYTKAIKELPREQMTYLMRGNAYFALGKYDEALADYDSALRVDPDDPSPAIHRGICKLAKQRPLSATGDFEEWFERSHFEGRNVGLVAAFCHVAYELANNQRNADLILSQAENHCPVDSWDYRVVLYLQGRMAAVDFFNQLNQRPVEESTWTYCALGLDAIAGGRKAEARKYLEWVVKNGSRADQTWKLAELYLSNLRQKD